MRGRVIPEIKAKAVQLYLDGVECKDLALRFGVCDDTVRGWIKKQGITLRTRPDGFVLSDEDQAEIVRLYRDVGLTLQTIGTILGTSFTLVSEVLHAHGAMRENQKDTAFGGVSGAAQYKKKYREKKGGI